MNMNVEKLSRTSSLFSIASLVVAAMLLIAMVAVFAVGIAILANESFMNLIAEEIAPETFVKNDVYLMMAIVLMCLPFIAFMFFLAYKLFRNISISHTPFSTENVKILKLISYIMLIFALPVTIVAEALFALYSSWGSTTLQLGGGLPLVFVAVLFYFMAYVFEYGAALQKESDETL